MPKAEDRRPVLETEETESRIPKPKPMTEGEDDVKDVEGLGDKMSKVDERCYPR